MSHACHEFDKFLKDLRMNSGSTSIFHQRILSSRNEERIPLTITGCKPSNGPQFQLKKKLRKEHNFLEWNDCNRKIAQNILFNISAVGGWSEYTPNTGNYEMDLEVWIIIRKLNYWMDHLNLVNVSPYLQPMQILKGTLLKGPLWNLQQKKDFDYSIRKAMSLSRIDIPEGVSTYIMDDINQFYPPRHLFPWRIPEDLSDVLEWAFIAPPRCSIKQPLVEMMDKNLRKNVNLRFYDDLDELYLSNQKKVFSGQKTTKSVVSRFNKGFTNKDFVCEENYKISFVTKTPAEARVIAIPDIPTRNHQFTIRRSTECLNNCKYDVYGKPRWKFEHFLRKEPYKFFIMVDQRKSGWTFPMELFAQYFKILSELYPEYYYFNNAKEIFENKSINYYFRDEVKTPLRGFTLGMYDNIMSFILACIFEVFVEKIKKDQPYEEEVSLDGLFWGDDQIISVRTNSKKVCVQIWNDWILTLKKHGVEINMKKSFFSELGVFCEVYTANSGTHTFDKICNIMLMPVNSVRGVNTLHRKFNWNAYHTLIERSLYYWEGYIDFESIKALSKKVLIDVRETIGWEFNPFESQLPFELGGWETFLDDDGHNMILKILRERNIPLEYLRVAMVEPAISTSSSWVKKNNRKRIMSNKIFDLLSDRLSGKGPYTDLFTNISEKFKQMNCSDQGNNDAELALSFHRAEAARQAAFSHNSIVSNKTIENKFYERKCFSNIRLAPDTLPWVKCEATFFDTQQVPASKKHELDACRAILITEKREFDRNPFNVRYLNEEFSYYDISASLHNDMNGTKWVTPRSWGQWCSNHGIIFQELYDEFYEEWQIPITSYEPPIYMDTVDQEGNDRYRIDTYGYYWDNDYGWLFLLSGMELYKIQYGHSWEKEDLLSQKLGITPEQYLEKCYIRHPPQKEVEDDDLQDDDPVILKILKEIQEREFESPLLPRETTIAAITRGLGLVSDLSQIPDYTDDEEEDESSSAPSTESSRWRKTLYDLGIDLEDLDINDDYEE